MDQLIQIRGLVSKHLGHLVRPNLLVQHVRIVEVLSHLMLEEPGQFPINQDLIRIVGQSLVAQQGDAPFHPSPAVRIVLKLDGDVVGHVPSLHQPDLDEMRLEFGNPVSQLGHLEKLVLLLQIIGTDPQNIGDQSAKAAQCNGGECQHRRGILQRLHSGQVQLNTVAVQRHLHA
ncbi:hypothetical protein SDC9_185622 [bioreactor metagenome]|uniref:Uncharacterized protein n=1 Tax=bioreactor metagenome TaxID=1076179 RepID=A0A645HGD3_9ZZZZ